MKKCNACGAGPRTCPTILPLSFGPDAFCLRLEAGNETISIPWVLLANELTGDPKAAVTVHQQTNGKILVTVGVATGSVEPSSGDPDGGILLIGASPQTAIFS